MATVPEAPRRPLSGEPVEADLLPTPFALPNTDHMHLLPSGMPSFSKMKQRIKKSPLMGPYATGTQLRVSKASKQYLYNPEEEEFLDCTNSAAHVGHCHPQVVNAAVSQMSRLATCQGFHSEPLDKYVRELLETFPPELSVCYLCNSGSEANDLALRMARQFTGNEDVVIHEGTYHGSLGVLVDVSPKLHGLMPGGAGYKKKDWVHVLPLPNAFNGKIDGAGLTPAEHMGAYVENARQRIRGGLAARKVPGAAALLVDPCFAVPGLYIPSKEYMEGLYKTARSYGALVISDEVQAGLGRLGGYYWGFERFDVVPDIVTVGKPLGNGHPLGAVICTKEVASRLGGYYSSYGGNPVSCTIGKAVLDVVRNERLLESARNVGRLLGHGFSKLRESYPSLLADVRGSGLAWALEFSAGGLPNPGGRNRGQAAASAELTRNVMNGLKTKRVVVAVTGEARNVILLTPPMCFNLDNARTLCTKLEEILSDLAPVFTLETLQAFLDSSESSGDDDGGTAAAAGPSGKCRKRKAPSPAEVSDEDGDGQGGDEEDLSPRRRPLTAEERAAAAKRAREELEEYEGLD